jgi:hypothetical protein
VNAVVIKIDYDFSAVKTFADIEIFFGKIYERVDRSARNVFTQCFLAESCLSIAVFSIEKEPVYCPFLRYSRILLAIFWQLLRLDIDDLPEYQHKLLQYIVIYMCMANAKTGAGFRLYNGQIRLSVKVKKELLYYGDFRFENNIC